MDDVITPGRGFFYETRDLYEAAVIHALGHSVIDVKREDNGICYFVFDGLRECEQIVNDYRNRQLTVNAKTFIESIKTMKDFIHGGRRG